MSLVLDVNSFKTEAVNTGTVTTNAFTTIDPNEVLFAIAIADGSAPTITVSGAGLTWTRQLQNSITSFGSIEVWTAPTNGVLLTSQTVTAASSSGVSDCSVQLLSYTGASMFLGGTAKTTVNPGTATINLTTKKQNSVILAAALDTTASLAGTVGGNQTKLNELADANDVATHTYWRLNGVNADAGSVITMNLTSGTSNSYNITAFEIVPASSSLPNESSYVRVGDTMSRSEAAN